MGEMIDNIEIIMRKNTEIIVATTNKHKLAEIGKILPCPIKGVYIIVKEDGKTFAENALKKARAAARKFGKISIADDSGLVVEALNGRPGVRSARFTRPGTSDNLCKKLLRLMKNKTNRSAHFVCAIAIASPAGFEKVVIGKCFGQINFEMLGEKGFGFDSVFIARGARKTFAQMSSSAKNRISHRRAALDKFKKINLKKIT